MSSDVQMCDVLSNRGQRGANPTSNRRRFNPADVFSSAGSFLFISIIISCLR